MAGGVDVPDRVVVGVEVPVEAGRVVLFAEVGVLRGEASHLRVVEAGLGVVQGGFAVPQVAREGEAVFGGGGVAGRGELAREAEVAPGVQVVAGLGETRLVGQVGHGAQGVEEVVPALGRAGE